ncbi:MAG TPA: LTA synthase family protein [Clostridia bacterium]|nr:LTA synthase family protein [Clostridia bacterium]
MANLLAFKHKLEKNRFILVEISFALVFIIAILLKSLYFQYTSEIMERPYIPSAYRSMLFSTLSIVVFISFLVFMIFNKRRKTAFLIVNFLLSLLLFADTINFRKYHTGLTLSSFFEIQFGNFGSMGGFAKGLLKFSDLSYIIDFPFIIFGMVKLRHRIVKIHILKRAIASLSIMIACSALFVVNDRTVDHSGFVYYKDSAIKYLGIYYYHYYDIQSYVKQKLKINSRLSKEDKTTLVSFFKNKSAVETAPKYKGIAKGKNLIIVQLESIQDFFINKKLNGHEITPNMNNLIKDSIYFSNFHYQIGSGNTSDAEFLTNNSLYPLRDSSVYYQYPANKYESLPNILKSKGYKAYAFHAYKPGFWNRAEMYKAIGFKKFYSEKDFKQNEVIGIGLSDTSLFHQSLAEIDKSKPFYSFMITLSSHFPFEYFGKNYSFDVGEYEGTTFGRYIKATNYVDNSIGELVKELKKEGLYNNTVLVIYGDHYGVARYQSEDLRKYLNITKSDIDWFKYQKIPCILHYPGLKNGDIVETTGGQIDIMPTLANIMGFSAPHMLGKDLLNTKDGFAVLRNGSFYTNKYFYYSVTDTAYDLDTKKPIDKSILADELEKHLNELRISDMIIQNNALKKLK